MLNEARAASVLPALGVPTNLEFPRTQRGTGWCDTLYGLAGDPNAVSVLQQLTKAV